MPAAFYAILCALQSVHMHDLIDALEEADDKATEKLLVQDCSSTQASVNAYTSVTTNALASADQVCKISACMV